MQRGQSIEALISSVVIIGVQLEWAYSKQPLRGIARSLRVGKAFL